MRLGVVAGVLLFTGVAEAGDWRTYLSFGAGVALDHVSTWDVRGATVNGYLGLEAPIGISAGVFVEGSETWGKKLEELQAHPNGRVQLDYRALGLEMRLRFFRDSTVSPWLGVRLARSHSTPLTPNEFGQLVRQEFNSTSMAVRFGLDWWLGEHWGATAATAWQWCDVKYERDVAQKCARPINTLLLGPTLRF